MLTEAKPTVSPQVSELIDRIRSLVAEKRRLDANPSGGSREAIVREIARLQDRLANLVRRELTDPAAPGAPRPRTGD
jgi:hypothetical protein